MRMKSTLQQNIENTASTRIVSQTLAQIEHWLRQHAPNLAADSLQPGVTAQQLLNLENRIAKPLPDAFKALYLWHNGLSDQDNCGSLFYAMDFFCIEQIEELYIRKSDMVDALVGLKRAQSGIDAHNAFNSNWIKFVGDGAAAGLYLDLAPTAQGQYGQIIFIDEQDEIAWIVADSVQQLIEGFYADLQQGCYQLDEDALEDGHEFLQCDDSIDLINWQYSQRWKNRFKA